MKRTSLKNEGTEVMRSCGCTKTPYKKAAALLDSDKFGVVSVEWSITLVWVRRKSIIYVGVFDMVEWDYRCWWGIIPLFTMGFIYQHQQETSRRAWYMSNYIMSLYTDTFLKIIKCMCKLYIIMPVHAFFRDRIQPLVYSLSWNYTSFARKPAW